MTSQRPRTASTAQRWTGAATACVPRAPARLVEGTEGRMGSAARARIASVGIAEAVLPLTPPATMPNSAKRPSSCHHPANTPSPYQHRVKYLVTVITLSSS
ncbi:hypothetical protein E2C01_029120 [Portunus trituberculatus]|uniref:Uncharacterized protein n=1 Tax=Portunus trituberculatus TaxID=210409 RepID=A0A5B7EMI9_PORTR|nr:hypothetical protein [Portunus trituberculatus]